MGFTIENPEDKIVKQELKLPTLPREEARRYRQAAREMADALMPTYMRRLAEMIEAEDYDVVLRAGKELRTMSMSGRSNEDLDPQDVIDGKVVGRDIVKELEDSTEKTGTGEPE